MSEDRTLTARAAAEITRLRALLAEAADVLQPFARAAAWADAETYGTWIVRAHDLIAAGTVRGAARLTDKIKQEVAGA